MCKVVFIYRTPQNIDTHEDNTVRDDLTSFDNFETVVKPISYQCKMILRIDLISPA